MGFEVAIDDVIKVAAGTVVGADERGIKFLVIAFHLIRDKITISR